MKDESDVRGILRDLTNCCCAIHGELIYTTAVVCNGAYE